MLNSYAFFTVLMKHFFSFIGDLPIGSYGLIAALLIALVRYFFFERKDEQEAEAVMKKNYQREVKKIITERESRSISDSLMDEDTFWKLIENTKVKSKEIFKNQCGLLKDTFVDMEPELLLEFQGTYLAQSEKANTYKVAGAFYIISNSIAFRDFDHFKEWLLSRGQIYFNNYIENPEWMVNANFSGVDSEGIYGGLSEIYFAKTRKLLPEVVDYTPELKGEKLEEKQVPNMFPKLWEKFLIN